MSVTLPPPIFGFENLNLTSSELVSCGILLILIPLVSGANSRDMMDPSSFISAFSLSESCSSASKER